MSWSIGYDERWKRDIGYGVPAYCDHPACSERIDRGLSYVCAKQEPYGGDGCGLYFCSNHMVYSDKVEGFCCERCANGASPFEAKSDHPVWMRWKLRDNSWMRWRHENPAEVASIREALRQIAESKRGSHVAV